MRLNLYNGRRLVARSGSPALAPRSPAGRAGFGAEQCEAVRLPARQRCSPPPGRCGAAVPRATLVVVELLRLALIRLSRPTPRQFGSWPYLAANGLTVVPQGAEGVEEDITDRTELTAPAAPVFRFGPERATVRVPVAVVAEAGPLELIDGAISVPDGVREQAEAAIVEYADIVGVLHQCKRVIRSPERCVAMRPSNEDEKSALREITHLRPNPSRWATARVMPPTFPAVLSAGLTDRRDGLALLADSLAEDTAVARARELFRLFERAFRRGPSDTVAPLTTFLQSHPRQDALAYDEPEVRHWLEHLRAESVHADRRPSYARSVDVEPYLARMEFAGYDVLFNKERWRHPSAGRRPQQYFMSAVDKQRRNVTMLHAGSELLLEWMDHWGVYPLDPTVKADLPDEWRRRLAGFDSDETVAPDSG